MSDDDDDEEEEQEGRDAANKYVIPSTFSATAASSKCATLTDDLMCAMHHPRVTAAAGSTLLLENSMCALLEVRLRAGYETLVRGSIRAAVQPAVLHSVPVSLRR